jgi:hypothetical protein
MIAVPLDAEIRDGRHGQDAMGRMDGEGSWHSLSALCPTTPMERPHVATF